MKKIWKIYRGYLLSIVNEHGHAYIEIDDRDNKFVSTADSGEEAQEIINELCAQNEIKFACV